MAAQSMIVEKLAKLGTFKSKADVSRFFGKLPSVELAQLLSDWDMWAMPHQRLPPGKWRRWILRGGRGSGKSLAANNTLHMVARDRKRVRRGVLAIVGRTHDDVRTNNVLDPETGVLATAPPGFRPTWRPGPGILEWPNGVICYVLSGDAPASIRGKNISFLVADELPEWPDSETTWFEILEPAVRKGCAQIMICMTPKPLPWLRKLESDPGTVVTGASTFDNVFLARSALDSFRVAYEGKEIAAQELYGEYIDKIAGALLPYAAIERNRVRSAPEKFIKIVVAVDPAVTSTDSSDETGIMVYGVTADDQGWLLADESGKFEIVSGAWAEHVVKVYRDWNADVVIAEVNNGGDFVEASVRAVDKSVPFERVVASRGKETRAEPVATLYQRDRIHHVGPPDRFKALEEQWISWVPGQGKSPNRIDAVVWAATYCHISKSAPQPKPVGMRGILGPQRAPAQALKPDGGRDPIQRKRP